ncbi:MAG: molybdate ABC transporter substrate-binding protein, partial [Gammaproteobacteria bacterium]|nr:molybdate ABC transporter substrate-binding protein [Gammaproteobacteria bacterium]
MRRLLWILPLLGLTSSLLAAELRVAVAANFYQAAQAVAGQFETKTGHRVVLIPGSTGKHYAQIINGAPFDVFLAADAERPLLLEQKGFSVPGTRHVYAHGRIVLWSRDPGRIDSHGGVLKTGGYRHLAIADPKLAPYGRAAQQALKALGVWQENETHIVYGKNINQVYQFASSGNAELGVIAASQIAGNT